MNEFYHKIPDYENVQRQIALMAQSYEDLKVFSVGKSVLSRDITALSIGNPCGAAVFVGATHGLEWLTSSLLLRFCHELLDALHRGGSFSEINVKRAMKNRSLVIIPCLNPDGVEIALHGKAGALELGDEVERICGGDFSTWQANANGIDINHNFDAGWEHLRKLEREAGINSPAPTRFGGTHPNSEPETQAATTFCMTYQPRTLYSFHSQGEEIYYRYGEHTPVRSRMMAGILAASSGYKVASPEGLAAHGGLKDWFIEKLRRPGFTIEIGLGKNPLGLDELDKIYRKTSELLMIATLL